MPDGFAGFEEQEHEQVRIVESGCTTIVNEWIQTVGNFYFMDLTWRGI